MEFSGHFIAHFNTHYINRIVFTVGNNISEIVNYFPTIGSLFCQDIEADNHINHMTWVISFNLFNETYKLVDVIVAR